MGEFNWIDIAIFAALFFYGVEGFSSRFFHSLFDLIGFVLSFLLALIFYNDLGNFISGFLSIPQGISFAVGFFVIALVIEIVFGIGIRKFLSFSFFLNRFLDRILGVFMGMLSALILVAFLLTLIVALPVSSFLKNAVFASRTGSLLVSTTEGFEKRLNTIFGGAVSETINFLTVEPESDSSLDLHFKTEKYSIDDNSQKEMFVLVNKERLVLGFSDLDYDSKLEEVAQKHCIDMIRRGYFSHYTLEGLSPFDRMNKANVYYAYAGENLALSPNVIVAMQGLMDSPGHRANILSPDFGKLGIGVIDAGIFGQVFCQEFTD